MNGLSPWPTNSRLFDVGDDSKQFNYVDANYFHRMTAQLLFSCERA